MSKSIRIRTEPNGNDKFIKVNLQQDFDFIEVLSLKISQQELYTKYCANYGAIIGRVIVNNGFGVPNAKVSLFVPISEIDKDNPIISGIYPFENITDTTSDGIRYNLLPRDNQTNNECFTPVGSFPDKRQFLDNDEMLDVYCEYYKFTTTTNDSGDYMIFGVPTGSHIMHVEADLSDIGLISQKPYDFMRKGATPEVFDSNSKFKAELNIETMINIVRKSPVGVQVMPFWGDDDNCDVAITRRDIDLQTNVIPHAIFMGSIFGDNEENSLSLKCKPSENMGIMDGMTAGRGVIEMIRKTPDGSIERYDISGGQLIDDDGTWAYQIPMNLNYLVTNEFGQLVPTDDPLIGIPTKANVRFRIGMDVMGTEGNLRERAKYLVPHNPNSILDVDFNFDANTKPQSFATLDWNQIYSIKNFIRRYEKTTDPNEANIRTFLGIKDVDSARGKYTPFPFNKLNVEGDFMFGLICLIMSFITYMVILINATFIALINGIIDILNSVLDFFGINTINYIPCITLECSDTGEFYAPGCNDGSGGCDAAQGGTAICVGSLPDNDWGDTAFPGDAGFMLCLATGLVKSLNILEWDFYNDWINGTLYAFLFRHRTKKEGNGEENFCEWTCGGLTVGEYHGVDNDGINGYDNICYSDNYTKNTCQCDSGITSTDFDKVRAITMIEGLIQKWKGTLYYAPLSRTTGTRLFATDIITLGASNKCNLKGFPLVQQLFVDTTYNIPPYNRENENINGNLTPVTSGLDTFGGINSTPPPLIIDINCFGFKSNTNSCINISRLCELGVGLDEIDANNQLLDGHINNADIDYFFPRNVFAWMNNATLNNPINNSTPLTVDCRFDFNNNSIDCTYANLGSPDWLTFRNPQSGGFDFENSFYFYFGLHRNATALSKMQNKYFAPCPPNRNKDFVIIGDVTHIVTQGNCDGSIDITVVGGNAPYTYVWTYPDGSVITQNGDAENDGDINGLCAGTYTLTVTDDAGLISDITFIVEEPITIECGVSIIPTTSPTNSDGIINIYVIGGTAPFNAIVEDSNGNVVSNISSPPNTLPLVVSNLPIDTYSISVTDAVGDVCTQTAIITGPPPLTLSANTTQITCYGATNGNIYLLPSGGIAPYSFTVTGDNGYTSSTQSNFNLGSGTYDLTVTDSIGQVATYQTIINAGSQLTMKTAITPSGCTSSLGIIHVEVYNPHPTLNPPNYTFHISSTSGGGFNDTFGPVSATMHDFITVPCGTYNIWYTNGNGCSIPPETRTLSE